MTTAGRKARAAFISIGIWLSGCSSEPEQPAAGVNIIPRVESQYGPVLNMELDAGGARSGAIIAAAGEAVLQIGQSMIAGTPPAKGEIDAINFTVLGGSGEGAATGRKIVHFSIDAQELRQLAHAGANSATILDSTHDAGSWSATNSDVVREYCAPRSSSSFCAAVR